MTNQIGTTSATEQETETLSSSELYGCSEMEAGALEALLGAPVDRFLLESVTDIFTDVQGKIVKIVANAVRDISRQRARLDTLDWRWKAHVQDGNKLLGAGQRTLNLGKAGFIRYADSVDGAKSFVPDSTGEGAFIVEDRESLAAWLNTLTEEQLLEFRAVRQAVFHSADVLKTVSCIGKATGPLGVFSTGCQVLDKRTGEIIPGIAYMPINKNAKYKFGSGKNPFSTLPLKKLLNRALDGVHGDEDAES